MLPLRPVSPVCLALAVLLGACSSPPANEGDNGAGEEAGGSGAGKSGSAAGGAKAGGKGGAGGQMSGEGGAAPATGGAPAGGAGPVAGGAGPAEGGAGPAEGGAGPAAGGAGGAPISGGSASPACAGGAMLPAPDGYQTLMSGGRMRKFLVRIPKTYDGKTPLPLIFAMHGGGANGMSFETRIAPIRAVVGDRAMYVYPDGLAPAGGGMITWARDYKDDLMFFDAILDWYGKNVCYDQSRVVALGQSSGAYIVHTMACHRPKIFRAVASNGGGVRPEEFMGCTEPVAVWVSNGAMDTSHLKDARRARDEWVKINGCMLANPAKVPPDPCVSYAGCAAGHPVHYCENGGGHDFPPYSAEGMPGFLLGKFEK